jgi:hypothetical protein
LSTSRDFHFRGAARQQIYQQAHDAEIPRQADFIVSLAFAA